MEVKKITNCTLKFSDWTYDVSIFSHCSTATITPNFTLQIQPRLDLKERLLLVLCLRPLNWRYYPWAFLMLPVLELISSMFWHRGANLFKPEPTIQTIQTNFANHPNANHANRPNANYPKFQTSGSHSCSVSAVSESSRIISIGRSRSWCRP